MEKLWSLIASIPIQEQSGYGVDSAVSPVLSTPSLDTMPFRLWHRLFLAFAALSGVALLAFAAFQIGGFQRGFLGYVNQLELETISEAAPALVAAHDAQNDWSLIAGNTPALLQTLGLPTPARQPLPDVDAGAENPPPPQARPLPPRPRWQGRRDNTPDRRPFDRPPPPRRDWAGPPPDARAPDRSPRQRPPRPMQANVDLKPRLLLLDANGDIVAGNPSVPRDAPSIPLNSHGQRIGTLLLAPLPRLRSDLDLGFARDQRRQMALVASLVLLSSLVLALVLSRWLLRPMRELAVGTHTLASGDFSTRLPSGRRDELGALANDFNRLAETLEQHRDARRQWGADIAHELRTPISILSGEIQALQDGIRAVTPERLVSLQAECGRLQHLVDDLYQLSLSDAGALSYRFERIDLADIVHAAVAAHDDGMREAGIELVVASMSTPCPLASADRERLRQLLDNLLSNALRYTDQPGRVSVSLECDAAECTLRVDDTAPGVPAASLPHLFERLYRVEPSRSRQFGGAGLGLAICRNIVEAHGGRISASPSPQGGLRIEVVLPVARKTA
jgi:two-component system, OmpR family, sensor histidine kinase BaeS